MVTKKATTRVCTLEGLDLDELEEDVPVPAPSPELLREANLALARCHALGPKRQPVSPAPRSARNAAKEQRHTVRGRVPRAPDLPKGAMASAPAPSASAGEEDDDHEAYNPPT